MREPTDLYTEQVDPTAVDVGLPEFQVTRYREMPQSAFGGGAPVLRFSDPVSTRPGFPERIAFDASGVMGVLDSVTHAPDALAGVLRYVPGVSGVGDLLGSVGEKLGESPLGKPLGALGSGVGTIAGETLNAALGRVGSVAGEVGRTFDDKNPDPFKFLDAPLRVAGSLFLGETGARAFDFGRPIDDKVWEDMPQDILDTVNIVGLIPAFKAAGLIGKAGAPGQFLSGATRPLGSATGASGAEKAGMAVGRGVLGAYGAGLGVEAVTPRFGDNEVTRNIMGTRIINDDSPWRFPFDIAASLPLDVFALTRAAAASKQSAWMSQKIFGNIPDHVQTLWPNASTAVGRGVVSPDTIDWVRWKGLRDAAAQRRVDLYNAPLSPSARIKDYHDLPAEIFARLDDDVEEWLRTNPREAYESARKQVSSWPGMSGLDEANQMLLADEYAKIGREVELANPGRILGVADSVKAVQAPLAARALDEFSEWGKAEQALFRKEFPAFSDDVDEFIHPNRKADLRTRILESAEAGGAPVKIPVPAELGALVIQKDRLASRLLKGEDVGKQWQETLGRIKAIREEVASGYAKQREELVKVVDELEDRVPLAKDDFEAQTLRQALETAREKLSGATLDYYKALTAGGRWSIEHPPSGNVMRLTDEVPAYPPRAKRTPAGKVYDALFGQVKNTELGEKAHQQMRDWAAEVGATPSQVDKLFEDLHKFVEEWSVTLSGGMRMSPFTSLWHLPPNVINKRFAEALGAPPKRFGSWAEAVYRAYPGPIKIFTERALGKSIEIPYNTAFHALTRTAYPIFRFYMSPRFILMNMNEARIYRAALGAKGTPEGPAWDRLYKLAQHAKALEMETGGALAKATAEQIGAVAYARRPDEAIEVLLNVLNDHPALEGVLKDAGVTSKSQMVDFVDKTLQRRVKLMDDQVAATTREAAIADEIAELEKAGKNADAKRKELTAAKAEREMREEARKQGWSPELQPFLDGMIQKEIELVESARKVFQGNPDRSALERVMNSYLLYWPLSYQLKAGKVLAELMLSRGFGYRTGVAGAQSWLEVRQWHDEKLQSDPEYAAKFKNNRDLLFVAQQLIPITPEDVGVSLSPVTRIPFRLARGESPSKIWESLTNLGAIYDYKLGEEIVREQSRDGGMLHDALKGLTNGSD